MKPVLALTLTMLLAACGKPSDRLTDEQARASYNDAVLDGADPFAANEAETMANAAAPAVVPEPGKAGPVIYQAVGTEPGWSLIVRPGRIDYTGDYGETRIAEITPPGFRPEPGSWRAGRLQLTITPGPCSDGMSDLTYRQNVALVADGKPVKGCGGGTVAPASLDGTRWTVVAINGRPVPVGADYFLAFARGTLSARFGCNSIGGPYSQNGDHLSAGDLEQTLIGCPEPAAQFEQQGSAVLTSNMRAEFIGGQRMRLVSEAGSIELRRAI